jgi:adenosylmethionine-8-amino-7-oxononanoate aminotransferase
MPLLFQISEHIAEAITSDQVERLQHLVQLRGHLIHEAIALKPINLRKWTTLLNTTDELARWCHAALDKTATELRELRLKKKQFLSYETRTLGTAQP